MIKLMLLRDGPINDAQLLGFLLLVPFLSPKPKSFADKLAQRHDREWHKGAKTPLKIFTGGNHYIAGWFKGIFTKEFWEKPLDSIIVGGGGVIVLGCMNYAVVCYAAAQ